MTQLLTSFAPLAERFDAFIIDQFGVLMDGAGAYPFAAAALAELARRGKTVLLLSNSGKRSSANEARLARFGLARSLYRHVLTSGETAHLTIGQRLAPGAPVYLLTTDDETNPLDGLDVTRAATPAEAKFVWIAGCRPQGMSLDDYAALLRPAAAAGLPAFCANPDMVALTGAGPRFGPGRVAQLYLEMGGAVEWFGKPWPAIYAEALRRLADHRPNKILCVGDSPAHDILGGRRAGLATALVRTGLHADETDESVLGRAEALGAPPDYLLPRFQF